jgi:hypothetical protein
MMKRFTLHEYLDLRRATLSEDPKGAWVRFNEAWPIVAKAQKKLHKERLHSIELKCQLAEVTRERDQLRAAVELADALRNCERASNRDLMGGGGYYGNYEPFGGRGGGIRGQLGFKENDK